MLWKTRFALLTLTLAVLLAALLGSQHRLRLVIEPLAPLDSVHQSSWSPQGNSSMRFMPMAGVGDGIPHSIQVLADFHNVHPTQPGDPLPIIDDPDSCKLYLEQGKPLHCYNVDIGMSEVLARYGIYSRLWDLNGSQELGGYGHNLLEVWDNSTRSWKAIDPYYHCYFTLGADSVPIGFADLRHALLVSNPSLSIQHYYNAGPERASADILSELRFLAPCAILHANNDFRWRYDHRYGFLMPLATLFDKLPLRTGRALRTLMLGNDDLRYIIEDSHSPHYPIGLLKGLFYLLLFLFLCSLIALLTVHRIRPNSGTGKPASHK